MKGSCEPTREYKMLTCNAIWWLAYVLNTYTAPYFVFKLNLRTFDERPKKVHHFNNVRSEKRKEGPERDSNLLFSNITSCTSPLSHQNNRHLER